MTLPALPAQGSASWFPWAAGIHEALEDPASNDALRAAITGLAADSAMPGLSALPRVDPAPPTTTAGVASAASAISGSVLVDPSEPGAFSYFGAAPIRGILYPDYLGVRPDLTYEHSSPSPYAVEFTLDTADATGRFEIYVKGSSAGYRVLTRGEAGWQYVTVGATFTHPSTGEGYLDLITLGAAGVYDLRLECDPATVFFGLRAGPTDSVRATGGSATRVILLGDSFTEPTFSDSGTPFSWDGYPSLLAYISGRDIWSAGSGGTGYANPGSGGRVKAAARLADDVIPHAPDEVWWACGLNDNGYASTAAIVAEAQAGWAAAAVALPRARQVVFAPWWRGGEQTMPSTLVSLDAALKSAAEAAGYVYLPVFIGAPPEILNTTLGAGASASTSQIVVEDAWPLYGPTYVAIDRADSTKAEIRKVTGVDDNGNGTWTLTLAHALTYSHNLGATAVRVGGPLMSGSGNQGSPTGSGTADRFTGPDSTHPTKAGHRNIAVGSFPEMIARL